MTRYYFNIRRERRLIADDEGMEFGDIAGAMEEAFARARELASEALKSGRVIDGTRSKARMATGKSCSPCRFGLFWNRALSNGKAR